MGPVTRRLHHLRVGTAGTRITFCHGLFGQGRNWHQIAKALSGPHQDRARCLLLDLPDHGRSPWSLAFSVDAYADAVAFELRRWNQGEPGVLVGHSLGGKVAMLVALAHPDLVRRLAVVDIAPRHYRGGHWYLDYIAAMKAIPLEHLSSRSEADRALAATVPDPTVRAFLLQNLRQRRGKWYWQANLDGLAELGTRRSSPAGWPAAEVASYPAYPKPVLWIAGSESGYVTHHDEAPMKALFPKVRQITVKGAGHWVHSEAPEVMVEALRRFARIPAH